MALYVSVLCLRADTLVWLGRHWDSVLIVCVPGNVCMVTGGHNLGRVGLVTHRERHHGGFDIVHIKDSLGHQFATRSVAVATAFTVN